MKNELWSASDRFEESVRRIDSIKKRQKAVGAAVAILIPVFLTLAAIAAHFIVKYW